MVLTVFHIPAQKALTAPGHEAADAPAEAQPWLWTLQERQQIGSIDRVATSGAGWGGLEPQMQPCVQDQ